MKRKFLIVFLLLLVVLLVVVIVGYFWKNSMLTSPQNIICKKQGGDLMLNSRSEIICNLKTKDKNKVCIDSSQCEGYCRAPKNSKLGEAVQGHCSEYQEKSTDWQEVINGIAGAPVLIN